MSVTVTLISVAVLSLVTLAIAAGLRLERPWLHSWAIVRASAQLGILSLVINGIIEDPWWVVVFLAGMVFAAAFVVLRRLELAL
jgi:putative ABC transport system permease protein